jgi:ribosomal protein L30/L7E
MFLRFAIPVIDDDSEQELGVFQAIHKLRRSGVLSDHEVEQDDLIGRWFDKNLLKPSRFTAAKPPFYRKKQKAISWFKDTAHEHITQVRSLVTILQNHGVTVQMLRAERVGYVVYEDEYQIVAEPFAGEQR